MLRSERWLKKFVQNTFQSACNVFCILKIHNEKYKNLEKVTIQKSWELSVAFQRYIICIIPINGLDSTIELLHTDRIAVPTLRKRSTVVLCRSSTISLSREYEIIAEYYYIIDCRIDVMYIYIAEYYYNRSILASMPE